MSEVISEIVRLIRTKDSFLVASHMNPDGDAIGSSLGLAMALEALGKSVAVYNQGPVPHLYRFLPGVDRIKDELPEEEAFQATFVLDCSTSERVGESFVKFSHKGSIVVVDHHPPRQALEGLQLIRTEAAATAELIYEIAMQVGLSLPRDAATALYAGLMTDTGSFRFSNTTPKALEVAGRLLAAGADHRLLVEHLYESFPPERFRLLGLALNTLRLLKGGKVALVWITRPMFQQVGAEDEMTDGFVDIPRSIRGVEVAALIREREENEYRVNLRSRGRVDVGEVASRFGGGGHPNAAGFTLQRSPEDLERSLLSALEEALC